MEIEVYRLREAMELLGPVVPGKPTIRALSCFLIRDGRVAATNLEMTVTVELPEVEKALEINDVFGVVESVKAVVDCYMPVSGEICEINTELESTAELVNSDPHGEGWMIKVRMSNLKELDDLMDKTAYEKYLAETAE